MISKEAQVSLDDAREKLRNMAGAAGDQISNFASAAAPHVDQYKAPALAALIGALLGGSAGRVASSPDDRTANTFKGALMGAGAMGAGTLGYNMLTGRTILPGESHNNGGVFDRALGATSNAALGNAGAIGLGGMGLARSFDRLPFEQNFRNAIGGSDRMRNIQMQVGSKSRPIAEWLTHAAPGSQLMEQIIEAARAAGTKLPGYSALALPIGGLTAGILADRYLEGKI